LDTLRTVVTGIINDRRHSNPQPNGSSVIS